MESDMKISPIAAAVAVLFSITGMADEHLGNDSANKYHPNSTSNPFGAGE
jgi:hypothetical protein